MVKCIAMLFVAVVVLLAGTALPFLPGRYDVMAAPISALARIIGVGSLLLVPIGVAWLGFERLGRGRDLRRVRVGFVIAALGAGSLVLLIGFAGAASTDSVILGVVGFVFAVFLLGRSARRVLALARQGGSNLVGPALAMIVVPIVTAAAILGMASPLQQWSQNRTMDAMQRLIDDIEQYRVVRGSYPPALFAELMDYRAELIGVRGYQYQPVDDKYSIAIEIPAFDLTARVFLIYNPNNSFRMASHDEWPLTWTDEQLARHRGYATSREVDRAHWRILCFD